MARRAVLVAAGVVVAGVAGCGGIEVESSHPSSTTPPAAGTVGDSRAKVVIDGTANNVQGTIVCTSIGGNAVVAIGEMQTGIVAVLTNADPPEVKSVWLGNVQGMTLGYEPGAPRPNAKATKDGDTYTITGTATGVDTANRQPVSMPFEIQATCP
jgi:lipoprotein LpqH